MTKENKILQIMAINKDRWSVPQVNVTLHFIHLPS